MTAGENSSPRIMTAGENSSPRIMTLWEEMENCLPARLLNYHLACVLLILRYQLNTLSELIWLRAQNNAFTADLNIYLCIAAYICIFLYSLTLLPLPTAQVFDMIFTGFWSCVLITRKCELTKCYILFILLCSSIAEKKQFIHLKLWHIIFFWLGRLTPLKL